MALGVGGAVEAENSPSAWLSPTAMQQGWGGEEGKTITRQRWPSSKTPGSPPPGTPRSSVLRCVQSRGACGASRRRPGNREQESLLWVLALVTGLRSEPPCLPSSCTGSISVYLESTSSHSQSRSTGGIGNRSEIPQAQQPVCRDRPHRAPLPWAPDLPPISRGHEAQLSHLPGEPWVCPPDDGGASL